MLAGLSPNQLSMANTVLASALAGAMGIVAAPLAQANSTTLVLFIVPALAAALFAGFTSLWIALLAGFGIGIGQSLMSYATTLSWFPTDRGNPLPGVQALLTFLLLVLALSLRGASLPTRGELVEKRLPAAPRPRHLARPAVVLAIVGIAALVVLPFGYRQALMVSLIGMAVCLSLVVITGFVGQVSLVQVTLAGVVGVRRLAHGRRRRHRLPVGTARRLHRRCGGRPDRRCVRAAGPRRQPRRGDAGRRRRHRAVRLRQLEVGRRPIGLARRAAQPVRGRSRQRRGVPRARRQGPESGARLRVPRRRDRAVPARRQPAPQRARPADAGGAGQRAGRRRGGHQRRPGQDHGLRDLLVHRRHRGVDVRVQLRLGERRPVRVPDRARASSPSPTSAGSRWSRAP